MQNLLQISLRSPFIVLAMATKGAIWRCDVCKIKTFTDFKAACDHELTCSVDVGSQTASPQRPPPAPTLKPPLKLIDMTTIDNDDDKTDVNIHTNTLNNNTTITPPLQQPNLDKKRKMGETGPEGERLLVGYGPFVVLRWELQWEFRWEMRWEMLVYYLLLSCLSNY